MKIGILQTGHVPSNLVDRHGSYTDMFGRLLAPGGFEFETYSVVDGHFPAGIRASEGWLITGSQHGAYEPHAWIARLEDFIRAAHGEGIPVAGICFGHQVMAQALGGQVEKFAGGWGAGSLRYRREGNGEITLNAMHQDQVVERPRDSAIILSSEFCRFAGLTYGDRAISFQPHPEFSLAYMSELIELRRKTSLPAETAAAALESLQPDTDADLVGKQLCEFFLSAPRES